MKRLRMADSRWSEESRKSSGQAVRHKQKRLRLQGKHPRGACDQHLYGQIQGGGVNSGAAFRRGALRTGAATAICRFRNLRLYYT